MKISIGRGQVVREIPTVRRIVSALPLAARRRRVLALVVQIRRSRLYVIKGGRSE